MPLASTTSSVTMSATTAPAEMNPARETTRAILMIEREPGCFRIAHLIGWVAGAGRRMDAASHCPAQLRSSIQPHGGKRPRGKAWPAGLGEQPGFFFGFGLGQEEVTRGDEAVSTAGRQTGSGRACIPACFMLQ
jgi:hypothetical protein